MKKLLALVITTATLALHGAGCASCAERRAQMLANRPAAKQAFPKHVEEINAYDAVLEGYENGHYIEFLENQQMAYEKSTKVSPYKRLLKSHKPPYQVFSFHFGIPSLVFFVDHPTSLWDLRYERGQKFMVLLEENEETFLKPLLEAVGTFELSECQSQALQNLSRIRHLDEEDASDLEKALIQIDHEFLLKQYLLNHSTLRHQSIDLVKSQHFAAVLELEMIHQMHNACLIEQDHEMARHLEVIKSLIIPMTKILHWEKVLQMLASGCYKLPGKVEKNVVEIQKEYMKKKSNLIRKDPELAFYR